ncbi:MAG: FitA-like ribbon-helix-helix domain-containing protein [Actinomycetales bacterium]
MLTWIIVRGLEESVKQSLTAQAKADDLSMEAEGREILSWAARPPHIGRALLSAAHKVGGWRIFRYPNGATNLVSRNRSERPRRECHLQDPSPTARHVRRRPGRSPERSVATDPSTETPDRHLDQSTITAGPMQTTSQDVSHTSRHLPLRENAAGENTAKSISKTLARLAMIGDHCSGNFTSTAATP